MSIEGLSAPLYEISCDRPDCPETFRSRSWFDHSGARNEAAADGWQVRPTCGKGSRSAPDLCPVHALAVLREAS